MSQQDPKKREKTLRPLATLFPYLLRHKTRLVLATIALLAAAGLTLVLPIAVRYMVDYGFSADNPNLIDDYFIGIIFVIALLAVTSALRYYMVMMIGERVVADLRSDVFRHLTYLSPSFYDRSKSGEIISRLTADTTLIQSAFGASASIALRHVLMFAGSTTLMVITSPRLSLFVLLAIPLIVLPLLGFGRSVRNRTSHAQSTLANAIAYATEVLGSIRTLQAFTNEKTVSDQFGVDIESTYEAALVATKARAFLIATIILIIASSIVAVLWVGSLDVVEGRMSGGQLTQFLIYSIIAAGAMSELSQVWGELAKAAGAADRITGLLHVPSEINAPAKPVALPSTTNGEISFNSVSFHYPTAKEAGVLESLNLSIKKGETVAIVGPSGAGKSTLIQLLMRYYDPVSGQITMDGVQLDATDPRELRKHIALVPQDTAIFGTSIAENISFGKEGATREQVIAAAKFALAANFIQDMKDGYDTVIGERGVTLSGGQRQRIAIARAILKDAPVLLLDEATSALDAQSETIVQKALDKLMKGRTTLIIAHRLATVLKADRIVVMDRGKIVEEGTHDTLVAQNGLYAKLARMQFEVGSEALNSE
ncbi:Lipid A export ATP-binding/permease protein MsbA [Pseudovibrio axinellae]|uniref:Lipid A export ATP-binding/permease protein MsbA n=1 Tax=Pseudovibrio axinellae TaxID=989403 RepID=A0A161XG66_9HYPH|nr:ABC transporter transmembrane domain-containing protein [Pseudovibrio axinellae]KZL20805.1 Lipid A export ATP-binding/permease protein MsbA [Pseudovibrio axinellae]SER22012.1 ATP-binding cassette, subfamily B [Pseudovibrio axinellae]